MGKISSVEKLSKGNVPDGHCSDVHSTLMGILPDGHLHGFGHPCVVFFHLNME